MLRLKALREAAGLTQDELGQRLNVGKGTVSRYENDRRQLDPVTICALCDLFGCTADYLLGRSERPLPVITEEDAEILAAYHALPLAIRQAVDGLLEPYRPQAQEKKPAAGSM